MNDSIFGIGPATTNGSRVAHKPAGVGAGTRPPTYKLDPGWANGLPIACRGEDPELFFPGGNSGAFEAQIDKAKAVCGGCAFRKTCLAVGIANHEAGIWGGTTEEERRAMRKKAS